MAKIEVTTYDAEIFRRAAALLPYTHECFYLNVLAQDVDFAMGTHEEIPGADGEPDYCGLTFKQRP